MQRIEEIALGPDDFKAIGGSPHRALGMPATGMRGVIGIGKPAQPSADFWALGAHGDSISAAFDLAAGDRILSLEPDVEIEAGYMTLDLIERTPAGDVVLLHLDTQTPGAPRPTPVRRTLGEGSTAFVRIAADLQSTRTGRRVFGVYLRVARARRSS
jgi:hypothetical protein